jgi:peptidoglycan/LPS O-acetylase OafA/YrhL
MQACLARPATRRSTRQFRPDIEGLRAVAVLGVVLYHAHVGLLRGGFAGVDVFFVVSGYLITGLLWDELQSRGHISLGAFYARRARRLLPASVLVVAVTAVSARHWLPPLQVPSVAKDGVSSALYVANYRFAMARTDYLHASSAPSPFQHYWSLGVEEQFYLVWPLLILGASLVWRYQGRYQRGRLSGPGASRVTAGVALTAITAASFLLGSWLTHANQPWAFFSLASRAWELGVGGVLALTAPTVRRISGRVAPAMGWGGLLLIVASFVMISSTTPYPGTAALAPVLGAALVLAAGAGAGRTGPVRILGQRHMRMMGRISYSWYLWHWPMLILAPYALGRSLNLPENLLIAALSGLVAAASFLLVETPARQSSWLAARPRRSLVAGVGLSVSGAVACLLVAATLPSLTGHGLAPIAAIHLGPLPVRVASRAPGPGDTPSTSFDPIAAKATAIDVQVQAAVARTVDVQEVPANLDPTLTEAKNSNSPSYHDGCMDAYLETVVRTCVFGATTSTRTVVLFGDSHAAMWFPAVDTAANARGWRLLNLTKATCPPFDIPIFSPALGRTFTECEIWRNNVLDRITAEHPALVILAVARHYEPVYGFTAYDNAWLSYLAQMVTRLRALGSRVLMIGPVPKPPFVVPDCLSAHLTSAAACTFPVAQTISEAGEAAERAAVTGAGGSYLDTQPWFCAGPTCGVMVDNIEMWRDDNHISETYSAYLGHAMAAQIARVIPGG